MTKIIDQNYKIELKHTDLDDCSVSFSFDDLNIIKNEDLDLFDVGSLVETIEKIIHKKFNVKQYLNTYRFYKQLELIDEKLKHLDFVYLRILDKENKICKIGRTFDIAQRYDKTTQEKIIMLKPVNNDKIVESKLIQAFKKEYERVGESKETFIYDTIQNIKDLFQKTCKPYIVKPSYKKSSHIHTMKTYKGHTKLYVSIYVCDLIFHNYVTDPEYINKFNTMKGYIIDSLNKDVYISNEFNKEMNTKCMYWKFHKYTIIQNESDLYVNGSRLWNSIIKNDNLDVRTKFSVFLKSKRIQQIKEQFELMYPGKVLYRSNIKNNSQPYFSGTYVHHVLIHFIISYLNARYAIMVSELMYRLYYNNYLKGNDETKTMKGGHKMLTLDEYNKRYLKHYKNIDNLHSLLHVLALDE